MLVWSGVLLGLGGVTDRFTGSASRVSRATEPSQTLEGGLLIS